jgi:hypothetical protein
VTDRIEYDEGITDLLDKAPTDPGVDEVVFHDATVHFEMDDAESGYLLIGTADREVFIRLHARKLSPGERRRYRDRWPGEVAPTAVLLPLLEFENKRVSS